MLGCATLAFTWTVDVAAQAEGFQGPDLVAQPGLIARELPYSLPVANQIHLGIEVLIAQDLPAVAVATEHFRAVKMMNRVVLHTTNVLLQHRRTILP